jgi:hypothetical protein
MKKLLLVTLAALTVAGAVVGFIFHHPTDPNSAPPRDNSPPLRIEEVKDSVTTEHGFEGQIEFPFENLRANAVTVGIVLKDCQCARVQICLTPEEWKQLAPEELRKRGADPALKWETLEKDSQGFSVPARAAGLLRLGWNGKDFADQRYWARLWVDDQGNRLYQRFEVPVHVVQPVYIRSEEQLKRSQVDLGRMNSGEERTARFMCYSGTRAKFTIAAKSTPSDPCLTYQAPQPLTEAELQVLSQKTGITVLAGYRVEVVVHERVGDAQLDLGPFRRSAIWNTDLAAGHQVTGIVSGSVLGEVRFIEPKGKAFVDFGNISLTDPAPVTFTLESTDAKLDLTVDDKHTLDILAVELLDGESGKQVEGKKRWQVRVVFRKDSGFHGKFPTQNRAGYDTDVACSIVFQLSRRPPSGDGNGSPVRRLYVPVRGVVP